MSESKRIKTALVSVYHKEGLDEIITKLHEEGVEFLSTGGTRQFIESLGYPCKAVEDLTTYPSILGGRVKTLHPKIFGGILCRRGLEQDMQQIEKYEIPEIDLVIVDLYPFEATVASGASEADIIEKIDIGGISLIRAAAKNYNDVIIVASQAQYKPLLDMLMEHGATSSLEERRWMAKEAFAVSSHYDSAIFNYFDAGEGSAFRCSVNSQKQLRYGENPHQKGYFYGNLEAMFDQIHGKEISYNNLLDINAAVDLIDEFDDLTFAILKHNNACGLASRATVLEAWKDALAGDPVSAFGGVLITNGVIDKEAAEEILYALGRLPQNLYLKQKEYVVQLSKPQPVKQTSYKDMAEQFFTMPQPPRQAEFNFITSASFKAFGNYKIYPDNAYIFRSLLKRWNAFCGGLVLEENNLEEHLAQAVKVTGYNLSLQQYSVGGAPIDAFKGRYRLIFRGTQSQNRIAALLAAYAEYAGIGVKTALGMGGVKISFLP